MRIVFAPHAYAPSIGGAQRYTQGLAEALAVMGHEVHVVCADIADPEAFYSLGHGSVGISLEEIAGVLVHRVPYHTFRYRFLGRFGAYKAIRSSVENFARGLAETLRDLEPEVVVTLPHLFPNVEEVFDLRARRPFKIVYAPMLHEHDPNWSVDRVAIRVCEADGVLALTPYEMQRLIEAYGANRSGVVVVSPGVEVTDIVDSPGPDQLVLFVGRQSSSKRLDALWEAMKWVWMDHPAARLVIAGPPASQTPTVEALAAGDPRVETVGAVDEQVRRSLYQKAWVVVNPSLTESFGMTTLDAWAHSRAIVAVDSPVNRSVIRDDVDGLLTSSDSASLAESISKLLADPSKAASLGAAGRKRLEDDFTWQKSAGDLSLLLERL